jgi:hypothetical protein
MRVHIYAREMRSEQGVSKQLVAFSKGLERHGHSPEVRLPGHVAPCDLAVTWGVKRRLEMLSGRRALVLERGYLGDRLGKWTSAGFDGLNGFADFLNAGKGPERFDRHYGPDFLKPWRESPKGNLVVIMGQVRGDASLRGMNIDLWYRQVAERLQRCGHRVGFRPHPLFKSALPNAKVVPLSGTLEEALGRAKWVVTYNSNSGVDSVVAGVPTVTCDAGSMAFPVTGHDPVHEPPRPDRTAWAARMAWAQWTMDELASGEAWEHLKAGMA